jgi:hypothetical protein
MTALYVSGGHNHLGPCCTQNREDWEQMQPETMPLTNTSISTSCCIGITCLKWSTDGELSAFDLRIVLGRLARVDQLNATVLC